MVEHTAILTMADQ